MSWVEYLVQAKVLLITLNQAPEAIFNSGVYGCSNDQFMETFGFLEKL